MKENEFNRVAKELFGAQLGPHAFSSERSRSCIFYREVSSGFFHIVAPDLGLRGAWYDVKVFAFASILDPLFEVKFPDDLGIPTDVFSFLSGRGIGPDQAKFNCKSEENFRRRFDQTVAPLLKSVAIPYLDRIRTLKDLLPQIRSPLYRAIAIHQIEGRDASLPLLAQQRQRLATLKVFDENVAATLDLIDKLMSSSS